MKILHENGFPVPRPIDYNRHCVVMDLVQGFPLYQIASLDQPGKLYSKLMDLIVRLAQSGLIHGDFNEFNIMITQTGDVVVIDFPQMVSTSHVNAEYYFTRDVECIRTFFRKRFGYESQLFPRFQQTRKGGGALDVAVAASGFTKKQQSDLENVSLVWYVFGIIHILGFGDAYAKSAFLDLMISFLVGFLFVLFDILLE
jgi:RIO kinase 2